MITTELNRLSKGLMLCFFIIIFTATYWSVFRSEDILAREDNPRRVQAEQNIRRGLIVDRNGITLAASGPTNAGDRQQRIYPYPEIAGAIGYYSYQYGQDGLEAAFNNLLSGNFNEEDVWEDLRDDLLHRPEVGYDVRSTISLPIQQHVSEAMSERQGAAIVLHVPSGEILAMVSHPSVDPNTINLNWDALTENEDDSPLLNRVIRGNYQPGTALQVVLLSAMLREGDSLSRPTAEGATPVLIPGLEEAITQVGCLQTPPDTENMTLVDAFAFACPTPFVQALGDRISPETYESILEQFGLLSPPPIHRLDTYTPDTQLPLAKPENGQQITAIEAVGQGRLTVTPLQMARFIAAIANDGNTIPLHLAEAIRAPDSRGWQPLDIPTRRPALLRNDVALQVKEAMQYTANVSELVALASSLDVTIRDYTLYGHTSTAYAGQQLINWFLGFVEAPDGSAIVTVIVLEDAVSPEEAASVAAAAFQAAVIALD